MSDRLPPLTALRAFDAAARHMSFAAAAEELNVTPAALSFQIKSLEEHLGQPVFRRLNRAVELTAAGRVLAPGAKEGFEALAAAWRAARRLQGSRTLTVTAGPGFTARWLAPRMFAFAAAHPEIEMRFSASLRLMDFERDEIDVAIRFSQSADEGLYSIKLLEDWVTPMVSPALAETIAAPKDLARVPLLHQDDIAFLGASVGWPGWFAAAGLGDPPGGGIRFSQADHAVNAAISGAGAIMGRVSLTESALREGRLVMPFDLTLWCGAAYRVVCQKGAETRPQVAQFIDWVKDEIADIAPLTATRRFE